MSVLNAEFLIFINRSGSVSYTHLDVYKRQVTETPLQDSDKLEVAAKKAVETFVERIPEVKQYFKYIVIRQYEEPPIDPNKSYEYLSSVISLIE